MSEQEFELYLRLLSRCLGLTGQQREQIADELRDHLEERLEELARAGVPREKAVFQALDDFGDAAVLAAHFTTIARLKRRRFLMRLSLGSVAALAAGLLVAFAFWPDNHAVQGPPALFAQNKTKAKAAEPPAAPVAPQVAAEHPLSSDVGQNPKIEAALESKTDFTIDPQPLKDALDFIAQRYQIPAMFDTKTLEDASVDTSSEVKLPVSGLKLRQMIRLILRQMATPLDFEIEDGVMFITTVEKINEHMVVVVYDCRDLVNLRSTYPTAPTAHGAGQGASAGGSGGGMFNVDSAPAEIARQFGGGGTEAGPKKSPKPPQQPAGTSCAQPESPLIQVIRYAGDAGDWNQTDDGVGPKITEIAGLLVINQNPRVHEKIKRILDDLRRMKKEGAFAPLEKDHSAPPTPPAPERFERPVTENGDP
jgi:hypothetical protein